MFAVESSNNRSSSVVTTDYSFVHLFRHLDTYDVTTSKNAIDAGKKANPHQAKIGDD